MINKTTIELVIMYGIIILILIMGIKLQKQNKEIKQQKVEIDSYSIQNRQFRTIKGNLATVSNELYITKAQLEDYDSTIQELKLKKRNVVNITKVVSTTRDTIILPIYRDTLSLTANKIGTYSDDYTTIKATITDSLLLIDYIFRDSISIVGSKYKIGSWGIKNILFKRPLGYRVSAISSNPNSNIVITKMNIK